MAKYEKSWKDYGVSETVGFIIIFGIMMSGIALVTLYGYPALLDAQQNANIRNMERNMISLQSDVNALTYKAVPYKETTMQVGGGVLSVERPDLGSSISIVSSSNGQLIPDFQPGRMRFLSESGDISIAIENGAVVKRQAGGSVMLSEPRWFYDPSVKTLVITLIQINPVQPMAKSGISTVQMERKTFPIVGTENIYDSDDLPLTPNSTIVISGYMSSDYYRAWTNYMQEIEDVDRVIIKAWKVNIINI